MLSVRLLGEIEVLRDGQRQPLPPSRKTRALLGYLAATARPHRRDRLCSIFWEVPDDPRGALRWSLSRLRALVDEPGRARVAATRETVAFEAADADVDLLLVRRRVETGFPAVSIEELEALAATFRGEFLEGTDLPDLHDFQAWCLAEREDLRRMQVRILSTLIGRLPERAETALPHARTLVNIDPFNEAARASLLQILVSLGRRTEADRHFDSAVRVFRELGDGAELGLMRTWRKLMEGPPVPNRGAQLPVAAAELAPAIHPAVVTERAKKRAPLLGRAHQFSRLTELLDTAAGDRCCQVVLLSGEPGLGKTALMCDLVRAARARGISVFAGRAYETDRGHPYSPWVEALGALPAEAPPAADTAPAGNAGEIGDPAAARERLFAAVVERMFTGDAPVLLSIDDIQWCDEASADLLQHVVRAGRQRPFLVILTARPGELSDNAKLHAMFRGLRHARQWHEIKLSPLGSAEIAQIARSVAPNADPETVASQSGGNPLYAIEIARNIANNATDLPGSLKELVRDRVQRLPGHAAEVLTWASILGPWFPLNRLTGVVPLALDELTSALEVIERHELLRAATTDEHGCSYRFAHNLIHRAIYTGLSEPRRRLMHLKAARALTAMGAAEEALAADVAHHAGLAGETGMAAAACVTAGRRCLRLFANGDAEALARKGQRYAEALAEPERTQRMLELMQVELLARRTDNPPDAIARLESLAERALDHGCLEHARLGYHMLSHLRWEGGLWSDARRDTLRAEFVSRSADERQQVHAIAEAARCLAMLERDLSQAEALALEAKAMSQRLSVDPNAVADAIGLLRMHQGRLDEAAVMFQRARDIARRDGERTSEFIALEHLIELELQRRRFADVEGLCADLVTLGKRLRDGSEAPFSRSIHALSRWAQGDGSARDALEEWLPALRTADAKHRLSLVLIHAAQIDLADSNLDSAQARANEALDLVSALDRTSDIVTARSQLACVALARRDRTAWQQHIAAIETFLDRPLSAWARSNAQAALAARDRERPVRARARPAAAGRHKHAEKSAP